MYKLLKSDFCEEHYIDWKNVSVQTAHFCSHSSHWMIYLHTLLVLKQVKGAFNF